MKKKLIPIFIVLALIFTLCVNAEDEVQQTFVEPTIVISADSVNDSIVWDVTYDAITDKNVLTISVEDLGICVYDDPDTSYIDGIRVNGETVDSLKIPIDISKENKIIIRTTYKDDFTGVLAQIADGTYDYTNLLTNPVGIAMAGYYVLSFILTFCSVIAMLTGKNKKVKSSEDIAKAVDTRASEAFTLMSNKVSEILQPFTKSMFDTQESIVEAIVLMNSKDPNAHLEALECLKKVASTDIGSVISKIGTELQTNISNTQDHKQHVIEDLTKIAETAQEESANVQPPIL